MQKLVVFPICLLFALSASAQIGVKGGISYGATYGDREQIDGQTIESYRPSPGYQLGVTGRLLQLSPSLFVDAELLYESRRGVTRVDYTFPVVVDGGGYTRGEVRNRMDYLSLPLLLTLDGERLRIYAGPSFHYLLSGKRQYDLEAEYITIAGSQIVTIDDAIDLTGGQNFDGPIVNRLNVALNAGVELSLSPRLSLDLRVYHTVTDVTNDEEDTGVLRPISLEPIIFQRDDFDSTVGVQASVIYRFQ
jgi:hypothetical protein